MVEKSKMIVSKTKFYNSCAVPGCPLDVKGVTMGSVLEKDGSEALCVVLTCTVHSLEMVKATAGLDNPMGVHVLDAVLRPASSPQAHATPAG